MTRIIKRYANRKLYDTKQSSYVTLDQIQTMVVQGEDLRILDNKTKEDITNATLAQIIFEREKGKEKVLPLSTLRSIIQSGESFAIEQKGTISKVKDELRSHSDKLEDRAQSAVKEFLESTQLSLNDMHQKIDVRLKESADYGTKVPILERDVQAIDVRLRAVEKTLHRIEDMLKNQVSSDLSGISYDPHQNLPQ